MIVEQTPDPENPDRLWLVWFKHKGATAQIAIFTEPNAKKIRVANLSNLESTNRKQGEATELLKEIQDYCMQNKICLVIEAEAYEIGPDCLTQLELKHFYQKNGAFWVERRKGERSRFTDHLVMGYRGYGKGWDT
jgi:hypothetical protein